MNKEDYVSLEMAKMLKEKGYPQEYNVGTLCRIQNKANLYYENTRIITQGDLENAWCIFNEVYPTLYDAAKWLRNKHKLHIDVGMCGDYATDADGNKVDEWDFWTFDIYYTENFSHHIFDCFGQYDTYEEALNEGILEALKLI